MAAGDPAELVTLQRTCRGGHCRPDDVLARSDIEMGRTQKKRRFTARSVAAPGTHSDEEDDAPETNGGDLTSRKPTLSDMQAITASREALEGKIDAIGTDLSLLKDDHRKLEDRVSSNEKDVRPAGIRPRTAAFAHYPGN